MKLTKLQLLVLLLIMIMIFLMLIVIITFAPCQVTVTTRSLDGSKTASVKTQAQSVGELMKELGYKENRTQISPKPSTAITDKMKITVTASVKRTAVIGGKKKTLYYYPGTVKQNLKFNNISYDRDDIISPSLTEKMRKSTHLTVKDVNVKTNDKTITVKAGDQVTLDSSLPSDTIKTIEGNDGKAVYTYTTVYINGKRTTNKRTLKTWITKKVDHQLLLGTSKTGETGKVSYSRIMTGNTTAYYSGPNATGATGQRCHYGTCAVDPHVIPYGTRIFVEGYGIAVANDCGGAVKGNVIDLYMNSTAECYAWGRRNKRVYILK